jgi:hypothetical protein
MVFRDKLEPAKRSLTALVNALDFLVLAHPDAPRDWPGFRLGQRATRYLQGQLHLTVMVIVPTPEYETMSANTRVTTRYAVHLDDLLPPKPHSEMRHEIQQHPQAIAAVRPPRSPAKHPVIRPCPSG